MQRDPNPGFVSGLEFLHFTCQLDHISTRAPLWTVPPAICRNSSGPTQVVPHSKAEVEHPKGFQLAREYGSDRIFHLRPMMLERKE